MTDSISSTGAGFLLRSTVLPITTSDFTYTLAFKITGNPTSGDVDVISHLIRPSFGANTHYLGCFGSGIFGARGLYVEFKNGGGGDVNTLIADTSTILDQWIYCAYTRNVTTGATHFYIALASAPTSYLIAHSVGTTSIPGGNDPEHALLRAIDDAISNPRAKIAGLKMWAAELTEAEVQAEWAQRAPVKASPYLYLPLSVVTGTGQADAGLDSSGNARHYTVTTTLAANADEPWGGAALPLADLAPPPQRAGVTSGRAKQVATGPWALSALTPALSSSLGWLDSTPRRAKPANDRLRIVSAGDTAPPQTLIPALDNPPLPARSQQQSPRRAPDNWSFAAVAAALPLALSLASPPARAAAAETKPRPGTVAPVGTLLPTLPGALDNQPPVRASAQAPTPRAPSGWSLTPLAAPPALSSFLDNPQPPARATASTPLRPTTSLPPNAIGYNLAPFPGSDGVQVVPVINPRRVDNQQILPPLAVVTAPSSFIDNGALPPRASLPASLRPGSTLPFAALSLPTLAPYFDPGIQARSGPSTAARIPSQSLPPRAIGYNLAPFPGSDGVQVVPVINPRRVDNQQVLQPLVTTPTLAGFFETTGAPPRARTEVPRRFVDSWQLLRLSDAVAPEFIPSTSVVLNPTLGRGSVEVPFLSSTEVVFVPTFIGPIFIPFLPSTSYVLPPTLGNGAAPSFITSTSVVYEPTFARRPEQIAAMVGPGSTIDLVYAGSSGKLVLAPLPTKDPRTLALEQLKAFLLLITFRRTVAAGQEEGQPFRLKASQIHVEAPDDAGSGTDADLPTIAFIGGTGSHVQDDLGGVNFFEETYGIAGPGTAVARLGEYVEPFILEIVAASKADRRALVAGLQRVFRLINESNSLYLKLPQLFDTVANFDLTSSIPVLDEVYADQNRRKAQLFITLTVPDVYLARGIPLLKPSISLELGTEVEVSVEVDEET